MSPWCWSIAMSLITAPAVASNDALGMPLAVDHLADAAISTSRTLPGRSSSPPAMTDGRVFWRPWRAPAGEPAAPERAGRAIHPRCRAEGGLTLLAEAPETTAIVAANDLLALGV